MYSALPDIKNSGHNKGREVSHQMGSASPNTNEARHHKGQARARHQQPQRALLPWLPATRRVWHKLLPVAHGLVPAQPLPQLAASTQAQNSLLAVHVKLLPPALRLSGGPTSASPQ